MSVRGTIFRNQVGIKVDIIQSMSPSGVVNDLCSGIGVVCFRNRGMGGRRALKRRRRRGLMINGTGRYPSHRSYFWRVAFVTIDFISRHICTYYRYLERWLEILPSLNNVVTPRAASVSFKYNSHQNFGGL